MNVNGAKVKYTHYVLAGFLILFSPCLMNLSAAQNSPEQAAFLNFQSGDGPNVIIITAHDLGRHLNCYGVNSVQFPNIDLLPTLLDYLHMEIPDNIEGVSFVPYLNNETQTKPRNLIFGQYTPDMKRDNESRCVFDGRYWYIHYFNAGRNVIYPADVHPQRFASHLERAATRGTRPFFQLYDIERDPYCLDNMGSEPENREIIDRLSENLMVWMKSVDDPILSGPTRVPYYEKSIENLLGLITSL